MKPGGKKLLSHTREFREGSKNNYLQTYTRYTMGQVKYYRVLQVKASN